MSVEATVKKAISELPESLWTTVEASLALALAQAMDCQVGGAAASKEIDRLLTKLREEQPVKAGDAVDELERARAARRGA